MNNLKSPPPYRRESPWQPSTPAPCPVAATLLSIPLSWPPFLHPLRRQPVRTTWAVPMLKPLFGNFPGTMGPSDFPPSCIIGVRPETSRCGPRRDAGRAVAGSPGSHPRCVRTCVGSLTAQGPAGTCESAPTGIAFPILLQGRRPEENYFRGSIPRLLAPLSTLRRRGYPRRRMTRGRCGSLRLQR